MGLFNDDIFCFNRRIKVTHSSFFKKLNLNLQILNYKIDFSGAGRATADAFLRLIYKKPVASRPVLDLSLHDVRDGFMDLILDAATGLERKSWRSVVRSNKYLRFRKFLLILY